MNERQAAYAFHQVAVHSDSDEGEEGAEGGSPLSYSLDSHMCLRFTQSAKRVPLTRN